MDRDEREIRDLISTWMAATKAGDSQTVLGLMAEDVVFLVPGRDPMNKADFAGAARAMAEHGGPRFEGESEIQEIKVVGGWAFTWTKLRVTTVPADGGRPTVRAGHTLCVLKKENGRWVLARDANLLAPVG